ncbi:MAG: hypothetical protein LBS31_05345 [Candidatus Adiutrix sp.]|nr:hypothetical protein [Candidatus Adiutrix sp.]
METTLRGLIVPDYDILSAAPASVLNKLDRAIPALARLKARGAGWDMGGVLTAALRQIGKAEAKGTRLDHYLAQNEMFGEIDPDKNRPAVQIIALTLTNATQKETQARFEIMAAEAEKQSRGESSLLEMEEITPAAAFITAFLKRAAVIGDEKTADFDPETNTRHAALQYVYDNGGKTHNVAKAIEKLQKEKANKKTTEERRTAIEETLRILAPYSGTVNVYEPKTGANLQYQEGQTLFQHAFKGSEIPSTPLPKGATSIDVDGVSRPATNSEGRPLHWSEEGVRNFWRWFGDSKMSDEKGRPVLLYHATPNDFEAFDKKMSGSTTGGKDTRGVFFFTTKPQVAEEFLGRQYYTPDGENVLEHYPDGANIMPVYIRATNPNVYEFSGGAYDENEVAGIIKEARRNKNDSAALMNIADGGITTVGRWPVGHTIIAFSPTQIKSVNNRGTWKRNDSRVLYQHALNRDPQYAEQQAKFDASPAVEVTGKEIFASQTDLPKKMSERRNSVIAWLNKKKWLKTFKNQDTGWDVNVSNGSVRDISAHGMDFGKAQVIAALPAIIQNGIYLAPGKTTAAGHKRHIFASKVNIGTEKFVVGFIVEEDKNGRRFYNHELTEIENLDRPSLARSRNSGGLPEAGRDSVMNIVHEHLGVKPDLTLYQTAWNGAAELFEQFKEEFIGSGIGERLYGWGFYFSDNRHNADGYRRRLSGDSQTIYNGKPYFQMYNGWKHFDEDNNFKRLPYDSALRLALDVFERYGKDDGKINLQDKLKPLQAELKSVLAGQAPQTRKTVIDAEGRLDEILFDEARLRKEIKTAKEAIKIIKRLETAKGGALYKADIPENDVLLDYDAGLAEQPENVRNSLEALVEKHELGDLLTRPEEGETPDGLIIYKRLARELGAGREASLLLNEYGVKGAHYRARGSQDRGANTRNFVIYDVGSIKILESFFQNQTGGRKGQGPKGSFAIVPEGYLIELFKNADLSTLLHETGHIFFADMKRIIESGAADQTLIDDFAKLQSWLARFDDQATLKEEYEAQFRGSRNFGNKNFEALSPEEKLRLTDVAKQEYFARGFEVYLSEGKAPSKELQGAFDRFKRWLTKIYVEAKKALGVELTDEVRGVFDRLLAGEIEIAETAARNELLDLTRQELDALGLTGELRVRAAQLMEAARRAAVDDLRRDRDKNRRRRLQLYAKEAAEELKKEGLYAARKELRKTPLDIDAVRDSYGRDLVGQLLKKLPGSLRKTGGEDPEVFAARHGFKSALDMLTAILDAPNLGQATDARVKAKETAHDAAYLALDYLLDTQEVKRQFDIVGRKLAESLGLDTVEKEVFAEAAARELLGMPMKRAQQSGRFLADMRRALQKFRASLAGGDKQGALKAHRQAYLNLEFTRQSRTIEKNRETLVRRVNEFIARRAADPDARFVVMDLAARHGLTAVNERLAQGRDRGTILKWLTEAEEEGYSSAAPAIMVAPGRAWRDMSVGDFAELAGALNSVIKIEGARRTVTTEGKSY